MRIAVTGASGFCGGVVARAAAAAGAEVVCLGRRPGPVGEHRYWDATRTEPDLTGTDIVLHLAAAVGDPPPGRASEATFHAVNVDGTARLLDAAGDRPLVWVSSASVYAPPFPAPGTATTPPTPPTGSANTRPSRTTVGPGARPSRTTMGPGARPSRTTMEPGARPSPKPITEDHPLAGMTAYGRTKAAGERLARQAGAVILRPRAVYGPGDPHLLPRLKRVVRAGRALLPGPDIALSLTAVENLADACLAAHGWPAGAYNIADAIPYRRDEVVAAVCGVPVLHIPIPLVSAVSGLAVGAARLTRRPPILTRYALEQLTTGVVLDISRARTQGWTPHRTLHDFLPSPAP